MIQSHESQPAERGNARIAEWFARAVIVSVAGALAWYTWGHWGDFQIDNGREIYVPAAILKGKLLFRDLWYMYGPLAPYLKALLFRIFGVHLTVLFTLGLTLTIGTALVTFEIARQFNLGLVTSMVPSLFFLVEAFYPFIRNFVFPYSYAASLASFLGMACPVQPSILPIPCKTLNLLILPCYPAPCSPPRSLADRLIFSLGQLLLPPRQPLTPMESIFLPTPTL